MGEDELVDYGSSGDEGDPQVLGTQCQANQTNDAVGRDEEDDGGAFRHGQRADEHEEGQGGQDEARDERIAGAYRGEDDARRGDKREGGRLEEGRPQRRDDGRAYGRSERQRDDWRGARGGEG